MTDPDFKALEGASHQRAFTIANVGQLQVVTDVWKALDDAIAKGTSFDAFKKAVSDKLTAEWGGANPARVELIFRNGVQSAYNRGRWQQMMNPEVTRTRPFIKSTPILDLRTSKLCRRIGVVVLPASDPYWETHWPPLHHACRRTCVSLTREQAFAQGITSGDPVATPSQEGFGQAPSRGEWQPDLTKYPAPLALEATRKANAANQAFSPQVTPAPAPITPATTYTWSPAPTVNRALEQLRAFGPVPLEGEAYKKAARHGRAAFVLSRTTVEGRAIRMADRVAYLNQVGETMADLANRFPAVARAIREDVVFLPGPSKSNGSASYAMNARTGQRTTAYHLSFGPLAEEGYAKRMADHEARTGARWTVGGGTVRSTTRHELAHLVEFTKDVDLPRLMDAIRQAAGVLGERAWIRTNISEYATAKESETWAELVSMVTDPAYRAGSLPAPIERFILDTLGTP
jgi:SPP1 gp7 family putative phage head morphogenesis protein